MIKFSKMEEKDFILYQNAVLNKMVNSYELSGYGNKDEAMKMAQSAFIEYLPNGLNTVNQYLYSLFNEHNQKVGLIWFGKINEDEVFLYDLKIYDEYIGKGYDKEALILLEEYVKKIGGKNILVNIIGDNNIAFDLYKKLGYNAFNIQMVKSL